MKTFIEQAQMYAQYHQNINTRYTHMIGVPIVILSLMIFLGFVKIIIPGLVSTNLAVLATLVVLAFYFRLNWQLALVLTPALLLLLVIAALFNHSGPTAFGIWAFILTFIVGWGFLLYGHYLEGKKPALLDNINHAFIAPLFITAEVLFMLGWGKDLKDQIYGGKHSES